MPERKDTTAVPVDTLEMTVALALRRHGASESAAAEVARAIRRAEQIGNPHCGLGHLELDCQQLESGRLSGTARPTLRHVMPGVIHVDADHGFAQPALALGLPTAVAAAAALGVAVLAVSRAHTCAALGHFAECIAQRGFIGIAFTNASASVTAPGGSRPLLGTNPLAMAVPDGEGGIAFQFDQCSSAVNLRHVREAAECGSPIPSGWAVAPDGRPTTDPAEALAGALLPAAGAKGFGMGLMAEVLASFFTGSAMSIDTTSLKDAAGAPHGLGVTCFLLEPTTIAQGQFWHSLSRLKTAIGAQPGIRLPGTRATRQDPVVVQAALWEKAQRLAGCIPRARAAE